MHRVVTETSAHNHKHTWPLTHIKLVMVISGIICPTPRCWTLIRSIVVLNELSGAEIRFHQTAVCTGSGGETKCLCSGSVSEVVLSARACLQAQALTAWLSFSMSCVHSTVVRALPHL